MAAQPQDMLTLVYEELRALAESYLRHERPDHTLQPTALVHEVYVKLAGQRTAGWRSREEFLGVAAQAMRRILVDSARAHKAKKRGGAGHRVTLEESTAILEGKGVDLIALDDALGELAGMDPTKARLVELRFFGGLTEQEAANCLGVSLRTAQRDWMFARAWLRGRIEDGSAESGA